MVLGFIHPIFHFWFLVTFGNKITTILYNLCLHGQDWKKRRENHATKVTNNTKKSKDKNMGWTKHSWMIFFFWSFTTTVSSLIISPVLKIFSILTFALSFDRSKTVLDMSKLFWNHPIQRWKVVFWLVQKVLDLSKPILK